MSRIKEFAQAMAAVLAKFTGEEEELPEGVYRFAEGAPTPIECARPGTFVEMGGKKVTFTADDLKGIAAGFQANEEDPAHLKIGHDPIRTDTPDYGRVAALSYDAERERLIAHAVPTPVTVRKNREEGFRRCSLELGKIAGAWKVKALSLLGAAKPAIGGLASIAFADGTALFFASPEGPVDELEQEAEGDADKTVPKSEKAPATDPEEKKPKGGLDTDGTLPGVKEKTDMPLDEKAAARLARFEKQAKEGASDRVTAFLAKNNNRIPLLVRKAGLEGFLVALLSAEATSEDVETLHFAGAAPAKGKAEEFEETPGEAILRILAAFPPQTTKAEETDTTTEGLELEADTAALAAIRPGDRSDKEGDEYALAVQDEIVAAKAKGETLSFEEGARRVYAKKGDRG